MSPTNLLPSGLRQEWKYALLGGLASIPFASYSALNNELSFFPGLAGLIAGYLARRKTGDGGNVGFCAGFVAALPSLWLLDDIVLAMSGLGGPDWFIVAGTVMTATFFAGVAILVFGLSGLLGEIGARIGSWLAGRTGASQQPAGGI